MNTTQGPPPASPSAQARELIEEIIQGAQANDRPDLINRLRRALLTVNTPQPPTATNNTEQSHDVRLAAEESLRAVRSLEADLRARASALTDPSRAARLNAEYADAQDRLGRFTSASREWQTMLGEGFAAVNSDQDYYVRDRIRGIRTEAEQAISSGNPAKMHEPFRTWLRQRLSTEADIAYQRLCTKVHDVAAQIADHLDLSTPLPLQTPHVVAGEALVAELPDRAPVPQGRSPLPARLLTVFMPAYGGIMMTLVFSRMLGLHLPGWVIGAFAVLGALTLGGAAASGERARQRERRQSEAITSLRATLDEYQLLLTKQLRDATRSLQQDLRRVTNESVTRKRETLAATLDPIAGAAKKASQASSALADIDDDLGALARLREQAVRLLNPPTPGPSSASPPNLTLLPADRDDDPRAQQERSTTGPTSSPPTGVRSSST